MNLVVATRNLGKLREVVAFLQGLPYEILSLLDFPDSPEVVEDGSTFEENAVKKASIIAKHTGFLTLADDSGLEVGALGGAPGVKSARFLGDDATDDDRNRKVLELLKDVPAEKRSARFKCAMALSTTPLSPFTKGEIKGIRVEGETKVVTGVCEGRIAFESRGNAGFGYDPIFLVPEYNKTFGELGTEVKNKISHRAKALQLIKALL